MTTTEREETVFKVVGTRPVRHDGIEKVTGQALFGADIDLTGLLQGKVRRSPHAPARVVSIDTSRAESLPGVMAVITGDDLTPAGPMQRGDGNRTDAILAQGKVLYKGHPVAAVAASNPHVAEEAVELIEVTYESLPSVTKVEDAVAPGAPVLHDGWDDSSNGVPGSEIDSPNAASLERHVMGDIEEGFAEADLIVEREFRTKTVHQGYIEPQNGTASWSPEGRLTIWCSSQGHFGIRDAVAGLLDLPVSQVKVVPMEIGGGFGGKLTAYLEPLAAVLSKKSLTPVKMT
ncbi:MAG: molybdopterin-dependent oxidoreductase, partial [Chloroflexi bacterium]|nr:molybdopterin-dependent oxidoreductase [Chloroflexota bacterium]